MSRALHHGERVHRVWYYHGNNVAGGGGLGEAKWPQPRMVGFVVCSFS